MADNLESPSFGIEESVEMGMGSTELLKDLLAPETASENPDDIKPIVKEVKDDKKPDIKTPKVKEIKGDEKAGEEDTSGQSILTDFLLGSEETEEEETVPTEKDKGEKAETEDNEPKELTQFGALSKDLFKLGVFTLEEEEQEPSINTGEEFLERFNEEKKKGAIDIVNNFLGQWGPDYQNAFTAIFVKGVNPKDYFGVYNEIVDIANLDMTKEENQIAVIKKALEEQGWEGEDLTTEIERIKNYGDLEPVATKHHKILVKKEASRLQQVEAEAEREMQMKTAIKNQYINNVQAILQDKLKTKEFDGIPLNPALANQLQDFLLVDKWKTSSGETLTDFDRAILELKRPENHAMKVKIALLLKILEKDPTLSTIQKSGISKKTDQLFGEVARQATKSKAGVSNNPKPESWFK